MILFSRSFFSNLNFLVNQQNNGLYILKERKRYMFFFLLYSLRHTFINSKLLTNQLLLDLFKSFLTAAVKDSRLVGSRLIDLGQRKFYFSNK